MFIFPVQPKAGNQAAYEAAPPGYLTHRRQAVMVIDLRALSTKQIDFGVLPHTNESAAHSYKQAKQREQ
jgi:hypothetical protein